MEEAGRDQLQDALLAQPLDVHRRTRRVVRDPLHPLRRAVDVGAVGVALPRQPHERLAARRARFRKGPFGFAALRIAHRPHDLGDDVARLAHHDEVARAHVLDGHLVLVVQRRHADRRTAHEDRLQPGEGRRPPGAPDGDHDVEEPGRPLLGRELERDGPPGCPRRGTEHLMKGELVDLGDHAVDLISEVVARLGQLVAARHHRRHADDPPGVGAHGKAGLGQLRQRVGLRGRRPPAPTLLVGCALHLAHRVGPEVQRPRRGDPRVLLAQGTGGGVARVDEESLPQLRLPLVHGLELGHRHVDLAPHLEHGGIGPARLGQFLGHVVNGRHVRRHVLPGHAVPPRRRLHELPALVGQRHGHAVDLGLAREGE